MNRYGRLAQQHWMVWAPTRMAALPDPDGFFTDLGMVVEAQISDLAAKIAAQRHRAASYLEEVARLQTARRTAEEVVMAELVWTRDPELPLPEAREEWEQTRPSDENLVMWAERLQLFPDSTPLTVELEDKAQEWALSVEFLEGLLQAESPREYMAANHAALSEAANIRFLRELRRVKPS